MVGLMMVAMLAGAACAGMPDHISMLEPQQVLAETDEQTLDDQTFEPFTGGEPTDPGALDTRLAAHLAQLTTPAERIGAQPERR
ncbi:hypothetical protein V6O07_15345, partial [Arthrospira platensis SPKY2]